MQVDPVKPKVTAPGTKRLKLICDAPLSNLAFKLSLRHHKKVMSPCFPAGDCNFRLSVYQSTVNGSARLILPDSSRHPTHVELSF
jgi:hypothetical protein